MKKILEKNVEEPVVKYAKQRGCLCRKMNGLGFRGWPDRLFIGPEGRNLWIEFKRPGGKLSEGQKIIIRQLRAAGHLVMVVDDKERGKLAVELFLRGDKLSQVVLEMTRIE